MFADTDSRSYIKNHAFTVLKAAVLNIGGTPTKMVMMRNPWKGDSQWKGDYSITKGGDMREQLKKALENQGGLKEENGKYWISYVDFCKEYEGF